MDGGEVMEACPDIQGSGWEYARSASRHAEATVSLEDPNSCLPYTPCRVGTIPPAGVVVVGGSQCGARRSEWS